MRSRDDNLAYINGGVLEWARFRSGMSRAALGDKVHASGSQIADWESGTSSPPFDIAQQLAKVLRVPFGFLFLPKPPQGELPLPDFRTMDRRYKPTPDFLELLGDVLVKQDWFRDYLADQGEASLKFVGSFTVQSRVRDVAASIRKHLDVSQSLRQSVRSWSEYMSALSRNADEKGVMVMRSSIVGNATRRKISAGELQGFAVVDSKAPLVFVNSDDFKASQIFTLVHELAHIWIGQSAISNPDPTDVGHQQIEAFCNRIAAETLVPQEEFLRVWGDDAEEAIGVMARWFWVSSLVILRRAHDFDRISTERFLQLKKIESAKVKKQSASGGDYYRNVVARMGSRLTYAVLSEVQHKRILIRDASRLLDMKIPTLLKFADTAR